MPERARLTAWAIGGLLLVAPVILTLQLHNVWHADVATLDAALTDERASLLVGETGDPELTRAKVACAGFVRKSLHNPPTAVFDDFGDFPAHRLRPDHFQVEVKLRTDDVFGTRRRVTMDCRVTRRSGEWIPRSVKQID